MTLWALRVTVLGRGPWLLVSDERRLERLCNSPRKRILVGHKLAQNSPTKMQPCLNAYARAHALPTVLLCCGANQEPGQGRIVQEFGYFCSIVPVSACFILRPGGESL